MMISPLITSITFNVQYNTCNFPSIIFCVAISLILTNKLGVSKKTGKPIKPRKPKKKITEKTEPKKKLIKFLKKPAGSVRFRFYKQKTEKTEPKPTKNREKTEPNRFEPVSALKNRTEQNRNRSV